jgi:hypothetical protein
MVSVFIIMIMIIFIIITIISIIVIIITHLIEEVPDPSRDHECGHEGDEEVLVAGGLEQD